MKKIIIINYGSGNVYSVANAISNIDKNINIKISKNIKEIRTADKIILPGQGAISNCMKLLKKNDLHKEIIDFAKKKPLLGICVGEQMLFDWSEENNFTKCLGILSGGVIRFKFKKNLYQKNKLIFKIPHIGWNTVIQKKKHFLWKNIKQNSYFYFVHSYYVKANNNSDIIGETFYGKKFICAVVKNNIFGTQFHPEKSSFSGLQLYKNFIKWNP
ncbi:imidazole glycerol phosphate synthase subunit HisH [Candidatus Zinderia endosymbiont of Aphrophora alni]|uniref:imidazole glycerol phosphate synthase subunit HisH n=1 Tax=Candidatus Zinderia endosymbiont of Aphrophora alni TaxID=3077951 RepID=UPI0030CF8A91